MLQPSLFGLLVGKVAQSLPLPGRDPAHTQPGLFEHLHLRERLVRRVTKFPKLL